MLFSLDGSILDSVVPGGAAQTVASREAVESVRTLCFRVLRAALQESTALLTALWAGRPLVKAALGAAVEGTVKMLSSQTCSALELGN